MAIEILNVPLSDAAITEALTKANALPADPLHPVATSGEYASLSGQPSIPTLPPLATTNEILLGVEADARMISPAMMRQAAEAHGSGEGGIGVVARQTLTITGNVLTSEANTFNPSYLVLVDANVTDWRVTLPVDADPALYRYTAEFEFLPPTEAGSYTVTLPDNVAQDEGGERSFTISFGDPHQYVSIRADATGAFFGILVKPAYKAVPAIGEITTASILAMLNGTPDTTVIAWSSADPADGYVFSDVEHQTPINFPATEDVGAWQSYTTPAYYALTSEIGFYYALGQTDGGIYGVVNDGGAGYLRATMPDLGSNCTIVASGWNGPRILTGQTVSGNHQIGTPAEFTSRYLVVDRAVTLSELNALTQWAQQGCPTLGVELMTNIEFADGLIGWGRGLAASSQWVHNPAEGGYAEIVSQTAAFDLIFQSVPGIEGRLFVFEIDHISTLGLTNHIFAGSGSRGTLPTALTLTRTTRVTKVPELATLTRLGVQGGISASNSIELHRFSVRELL